MSKLILTGPYGGIGTAFREYLRDNHPDVQVVPLVPFPFSPEHIASALECKPDYFVNCAALGNDGESYSQEHDYIMANSVGVLHQLALIKRRCPSCRFLNLGSIYEDIGKSPYATSKRLTSELCKMYRRLGIFAVQPKLGFTEHYQRPESALARKIARGAAAMARAIRDGKDFEPLRLKEIDERFCWTWASDTAEGLWRVLNHTEPIDFVVSGGDDRSVRDFAMEAFKVLDLVPQWNGTAICYTHRCWDDFHPGHGVSKTLLLDTAPLADDEVHPPIDALVMDSSLRGWLKWQPKVSFEELVRRMVEHEVKLLEPKPPKGPYVEPWLRL